MKNDPSEDQNNTGLGVISSVLLFLVGYEVVLLIVSFVTNITIRSEVWQLTAWGFISSVGLIALSKLLMRSEKAPSTKLDFAVSRSSWARFSIGLLVGMLCFGVHLAIVGYFAGPIRFEFVPGIGVTAVLIYFTRFLSTSCMEELGFRGYALRRLTGKMGVWPAVLLTALIFGLSHLLYGYELRSIALGVIPGGILWGMSAIATRGLAVPIGLHAAWNFSNWTAGGRHETGLLRMIVEADVPEQAQAFGTGSYLAISAALTLAFWFIHRRNVQRAALLSSSLPDPVN